MNDDRLGQLLRNADESIPPPARAAGLVERIQRRRNRQRRINQFGMAAVFVVMTSATWAAISWKNHRPVPPLVFDPEAQTRRAVSPPRSVQPTLTQLFVEAQVHAKTAEILLRSTHTARRPSASSGAATTTSDIQLQRDRAALIMVYDADRSVRENHPADAIAVYRRAIELFPQTHWAEIARQRLREMQT